MDDTELVAVEQETTDLDAQIDALIRQATERLREQLARVRRNSESAHDLAHGSEEIASAQQKGEVASPISSRPPHS